MASRIHQVPIRIVGCRGDLLSNSRISCISEDPFVSDAPECALDNLDGEIPFGPRIAFPSALHVLSHQLLLPCVKGGSDFVQIAAIHSPSLNQAVDGMHRTRGASVLPFPVDDRGTVALYALLDQFALGISSVGWQSAVWLRLRSFRDFPDS